MSKKKLFAGKLGKSTFTFILGAMLMVSVSAAVAQTQNPPAGDINATFDSVNTGSIYVSNTLDFERIRAFMAGDGEIYLYPETNPSARNKSFSIIGNNNGTASDSSKFKLVNSDIYLEQNSDIGCTGTNCSVKFNNPISGSSGTLSIEGGLTINGTVDANSFRSPWLKFGSTGLESNKPGGDKFVDPIHFTSPVEFYSPISGRKGVGTGTDRPLSIDGDVKLNGGTIRNGNSGGTDMVVIDDNTVVKNSLFLDGTGSLYVNGGNILAAGKIGTTYKVTDRKGQGSTWSTSASSYSTNSRVSVTATCEDGTVLVGCSGYLWEESGQARFEFMGAEKSGQSCISYARRKSASDTSFSHYSEAICFDPSLGGRPNIVEY